MRKLLFFFVHLPLFIFSQNLPAITEKTKNFNKYPGYMNFYWEADTGKLWMEINKFDSFLLYHTSLPAGLGSNEIGLDRGLMGNTAIVKFTRVGNKIMMVQPNMDFRATANDDAQKRAVEESFASSTLWGFTAEAASDGAVLVDATAFLMRDALDVSSRLSGQRQGNYSIDLSRSVVYLPRTKNFPDNTELEASISFVTKDAAPGRLVSSVVPLSSSFTLRMHHSFVKLPDAGYQPRVFDPRSGCIPISYFDYSTPVAEPINKSFIIRHRLHKKDPSAALSEAVTPIVYYLDNGTPEPIRSALLEGAQWWNQAFEAAGYRNAFQVKILPADADPMDIRYNMINWVHRSTRGWSYGAAVTDPRTGEIIKGNVTLGSLRVRQDYLIAQGLLAPFENGMPANDKMLAMGLQRLKQLSAHEVGHTLGLMHNYISSSEGKASVMDYPSPVVTLNKDGLPDVSNAYGNEIGGWDKVAIAYAYTDFGKLADEKPALSKIITKAAADGLHFISDRDARDPGGMHPSAHLWDEGKNVVTGLRSVMKVREKALLQFGENNIRKGTPMALLEDVLVPVYLYHRYQLEAASKMVGGMNYSYALRGEEQLITKALTREEQLTALQAIIDCMDPAFLAIPDRILQLIPPRPAGYDYNRELFNRRTGLSFDALAAAETAADLPLSLLFNPSRLNRMAQNQQSKNGLGIEEMIKILVARTFKAPRQKGLQGLILQQNEQLLLSYLLSSALTPELSFASKATILKAISEIEKDSKQNLATAAAESKGNLLLTLERIENKHSAKPYEAKPIPPGAPIGCEF